MRTLGKFNALFVLFVVMVSLGLRLERNLFVSDAPAACVALWSSGWIKS